MKPEEKGKELIELFMPFCYRVNEGATIHVENAKQCAEICVKEVIEVLQQDFGVNTSIKQQYWQQVLSILTK